MQVNEALLIPLFPGKLRCETDLHSPLRFYSLDEVICMGSGLDTIVRALAAPPEYDGMPISSVRIGVLPFCGVLEFLTELRRRVPVTSPGLRKIYACSGSLPRDIIVSFVKPLGLAKENV